MRSIGISKVAAAIFPGKGEHRANRPALVRHPPVPDRRQPNDHVSGTHTHAQRRFSGKCVLPVFVLAQVSPGDSLHRAVLEVRIDRRDVHDDEGRCYIAIGMRVLRAAVWQVEIAPDIWHACCGWGNLSDKIKDAISLKLVIYKPRLGAGEAVEMTADRAAAREQFASCAGAIVFTSQLLG